MKPCRSSTIRSSSSTLTDVASGRFAIEPTTIYYQSATRGNVSGRHCRCTAQRYQTSAHLRRRLAARLWARRLGQINLAKTASALTAANVFSAFLFVASERFSTANLFAGMLEAFKKSPPQRSKAHAGRPHSLACKAWQITTRWVQWCSTTQIKFPRKSSLNC